MSEFESRVREALTRGAEAAPPPVGLADAARERWRRRRRTTGAVVAAMVAVAAVPVGIAVLGDNDGDRRGGDVISGPTGADSSGGRVYSFGDATVVVPEEWRNGTVYQPDNWCNGRTRPAEGPVGFVGRLRVTTMIACPAEPVSNYEPFASFSTQQQGPPRSEVDGWVTENVQVGSVWLTIRTDDPTLHAELKGSAQVIEDKDPNGCAPRHVGITDTEWRPEAEMSLQESTPVDRIVACGYYPSLVSGGAGPGLLFSDLYRGKDAEDLLELLLSAPETAPTEEACPASAAAYTLLTVFADDRPQQVVVRADGCHGLGSDDATTYRANLYQLTGWLEMGTRQPEPTGDPDGPVSGDPDGAVSSDGDTLDPAPDIGGPSEVPPDMGGGVDGYLTP